MNEVLEILDDWYSLKLEEAESYKEKKEDTSVGMSAKMLIDMGMNPEEVLEVAEYD